MDVWRTVGCALMVLSCLITVALIGRTIREMAELLGPRRDV